MAATHRILDDLYEETFSLFAIHSSLDDFAVVYVLNQYLKTRFKRLRTDLDIARGVSFPIFEWQDDVNHRNLTLIANNTRKEESVNSNDLFMNEPSLATYHLLPEHRDVDYLLKIDPELDEEEPFLRTLTAIPSLITVYSLDTNKLKSKRNLIF